MSASRIYERAVLRAFAEQLVEAAGVPPRSRVVELQPRSDMVAMALASLAPGSVAVPVRDARALADVDAVAAVAAFTVGAEHTGLAQLAATSHPVTLLAWPAPGDPAATVAPPLEHLVARAVAEVTGTDPRELVEDLVPPVLPGWVSTACTDVCRFDSVRELTVAVTAWHGLPLEPAALDAVVDRLAGALSDRAGFDGTLRVPVTALLLRSRLGRGHA